MKEHIFLLSIATLFFLSGCAPEESAVADIEMKSNEELSMMTDSFTQDDFYNQLSHVMEEAESFDTEGDLEKWVIRTLSEEALYYADDLTEEEVIAIAKERLAEDRVWKEIAETKYGVTVSEEELNEYIDNVTQSFESPLQMAYAEALGLTVEQLNHGFDMDVYEKNLLWEKLRPKLEKAYGTSDNNKLVEKYNEEVSEGSR
ncbi:hypothetical protein JMA_10860 [Jeotgalibacillus malaysiensis]|uniref:Uncharacterized protein n=1 Tax=Jeotgalibacillus malaysiensis TaxID=1508404 RepID=A0A0B5APH9_9BACL|nr:hypothetical protein [Jeotgalibacillus malaysiensis]AJD90403.1 hypothetical protein JMA_10860 [Jeotgalibacillus malaysiensis]